MPNANNNKPAYIKGFVRNFSLWDPEGFTETNLDLAGIPHCALDVQKSTNKDSQVNGIVFIVDNTYFDNLLKRESGYKLIETIAYDFVAKQSIGKCFVFSADKNNGKFDFNSRAQRRYLEVCLNGAKEHGPRFYEEFIEQTYIGDVSLSKIPELL